MRMTRLLAPLCAFSVLGFATLAAQADETPTEDEESRRAAILDRFDLDGDGELSRAEREAARNKRRQNVLDEFDADGDGQLSDDERTAAREARAQRREESGREGGMRGRRGGDSGEGGVGGGRRGPGGEMGRGGHGRRGGGSRGGRR